MPKQKPPAVVSRIEELLSTYRHADATEYTDVLGQFTVGDASYTVAWADEQWLYRTGGEVQAFPCFVDHKRRLILIPRSTDDLDVSIGVGVRTVVEDLAAKRRKADAGELRRRD